MHEEDMQRGRGYQPRVVSRSCVWTGGAMTGGGAGAYREESLPLHAMENKASLHCRWHRHGTCYSKATPRRLRSDKLWSTEQMRGCILESVERVGVNLALQ
jgi:hypothetical protein